MARLPGNSMRKTNLADHGKPSVAPATLLEIFRAARRHGWQLSAHVQGGAAIDLLVDTFAYDREEPIAPDALARDSCQLPVAGDYRKDGIDRHPGRRAAGLAVL